METVAVTGGCGLVGRFIVSRLQKCDWIQEIRVIDRKAPITSGVSDGTPIRYLNMDLCNESAVERAFAGCTAVVHCAHSTLPLTYMDKSERMEMWRDNLQATEVVVDTMIRLGVSRLVHVGDAFSALPIEDNYGLGEYMFSEFPRNYLLGEFGESRTRGEMYARRAVKRESCLSGIFLRPVHVHGEGGSISQDILCDMAAKGQIPYIEGDRRGMHQFIYAGNLAGIVEKALIGLASEPNKFSGEIVYCLDDTNATPYREFLENMVASPYYSKDVSISIKKSFLCSYFSYLKYQVGFEIPRNCLSHPMFRLLFEKTVGFSNKKLRLLMDYTPEISPEKSLNGSSVNKKESTITRRIAARSG